jgi:MFS family permease
MVILDATIVTVALPSLGALIAARAVQGVGAAMMVPSSLALASGALNASRRRGGLLHHPQEAPG